MKFNLNESWFTDATGVGDTTITASLNKESNGTALKDMIVTFTNTTADATTARVSYAQTSEDTGTCTCKLSTGMDNIQIGPNSTVKKTLYDIISEMNVTNATGAAITFTLTATIGGSAV